MKLTVDQIREKLNNKDLKVTPQRIAILEAISDLHNHPTVENIIEYIRKNHPNIATGTVYNVLDVLVGKGLINKVKTEKDIMRYDSIIDAHHHLYCSETDRIEDYIDNELDSILYKYFSDKKIPDFDIQDIKLQINGCFRKK